MFVKRAFLEKAELIKFDLVRCDFCNRNLFDKIKGDEYWSLGEIDSKYEWRNFQLFKIKRDLTEIIEKNDSDYVNMTDDEQEATSHTEYPLIPAYNFEKDIWRHEIRRWKNFKMGGSFLFNDEDDDVIAIFKDIHINWGSKVKNFATEEMPIIDQTMCYRYNFRTMMMEFFENEVRRECLFKEGRHPVSYACWIVLKVKHWCKKRKFIIFLTVIRFLLNITMLDCDAYTADWIWRKLVSEENEIKRKDDIDFNSRLMRKIGAWI